MVRSIYMLNNKILKERALYFSICFCGIFAVLLALYYLSTLLEPIATNLKNELLHSFYFFQDNVSILLMTLATTLLFVYLIKRSVKKISFLFSEETTDKDIYYTSLEAWKENKYDVVYDDMNYIYEISQKDGLKSVYSETAKAILLYQKTNFSNNYVSKDEIKHVISALLTTFNYKELSLNTIHLAYTFLHLSKIEQKLEVKAINHLISSYLFNRVDPIGNKKRIEIEIRIFNSYFSKYNDSILRLLDEEIINILLNSEIRTNNKDFEDKVIPFLREFKELQ